MRTNVLHTITGLNVGGAEIMLCRFLGQVDRARYASSVVSLLPPGPLEPSIAETRAGVHSIGMPRHPRPLDIYRLVQVVNRTRPDLLHGWMYHGNVAATLGALLAQSRAPVIWSIHHTVRDIGDEKRLTRFLIRLSARLSPRTAAISYCSRVSAADHEKLGFDPSRCVVIPNGTDCANWRPDPLAGLRLRAAIGVPSGRQLIGHVARAHPMKDQGNLVGAIARLLGQGHDVQGVFVGEGHETGLVGEMAASLGIADRITTLGVRSDVRDIVPGFDVFALCSAWGEAFSLAAGEAMASGIPCVVTDIGDMAWLVGDTGVVVPAKDTQALAAGLARILVLAPEERQALGEAARERVTEHFSLTRYVERHLELYERALDSVRVRDPQRSARLNVVH